MTLFRAFFTPISLHSPRYAPQLARKNHLKIAYNKSYQ